MKWVSEKIPATHNPPILKWAAKLKEWCELAQVGVELLDKKLDEQKEGFEERLETVEAEAQAWEERAGFVDDLVEIYEDMQRGVKDMGDLDRHMDSMPDSYITPKNSAPRV